jgi:hypothetical protein
MQSRKRESSLVIFIKAFPPHLVGIMVVQIAVINGVLMIGGAFLGMALDRALGTRPLLTLVLPLAGAVLSVFVAYALGKATVKKSRKAYLNWVEEGEPVDAPKQQPAATLPDAQ